MNLWYLSFNLVKNETMKIYLLSTLLLVGSLACNDDKKVTSVEEKEEQEVKTPPNSIFIFSDDHATQAIKAYGSTASILEVKFEILFGIS